METSRKNNYVNFKACVKIIITYFFQAPGMGLESAVQGWGKLVNIKIQQLAIIKPNENHNKTIRNNTSVIKFAII